MINFNKEDQQALDIFERVSSLSLRWNSFFDNLLQIYQTLKEQGFLYYNGEVKILDQEEVSK